MNINFF